MITKNAKTMLMFSLVATLFVPLTALATNSDQYVGKTLIRTEIMKKTPDTTLELLQQLDEKRNNASSDAERNQIQKQIDSVIGQAKEKQQLIDPRREAKYGAMVEQLSDTLAIERKSISSTDKERVIPTTSIGFEENSLAIGIHQDYASTENMEKYAKKIRNILGNDIDLVLYNGGDYWHFGTCATRLSDCTTIEAGVQMQVTGHGYCTTGFKATYNSKSGFVTAGHCADGQTGNNVGQATISTVIGTVEKETFDLGTTNEDCDCAFITSTKTVDKTVFGVSSLYYPHSARLAAVNDYVKLSGKNSGITTGQVISTSSTIDVKDDATGIITTVTAVKASYSSTFGDSGGPVMDAFSANPSFLGTNIAFNPTLGQSAYIKYTKFESYFTGISWGF